MTAFRKYNHKPYHYTFTREPDWYWDIRFPTSEEEIIREDLSRTSDELSQMIHEIALVFAGTNIPTEDGKYEILYPGDSIALIELVLGTMPYEMLWEIWEQIKRLIPGWGPKED